MLPKTIELPAADDFCRFHIDGCDGTHCFTGWRLILFPNMDFEEECQFDEASEKVAKKMRLYQTDLSVVPVARYNDHQDNSFRRLATWFEKTVERMGYDIK